MMAKPEEDGMPEDPEDARPSAKMGRGGAGRQRFACPLCGATKLHDAVVAHGRRYLGCGACGLIHMAPEDRPDRDTERARYETHENDPADPRYRAFLNRLAAPLATRLAPGANGLDYGSGPGPTLSIMLAERGFPTAIWDPFFAPDPAPLGERHDFITCTEVVEHFFDPAAEFARLAKLLKPGGILGIMTEPVPDEIPLETWYYLRDPTHVSLFREETFAWIARRYGWTMERPESRVVLYR